MVHTLSVRWTYSKLIEQVLICSSGSRYSDPRSTHCLELDLANPPTWNNPRSVSPHLSPVAPAVTDYWSKLQSLRFRSRVSADCVWHMWETPNSCQHGNNLAVQEWVWHGCSRATIPSLKRPQSKEMTSQQKRSRCHHWVLSLPLGHTILNQNRPAWPGSTKLFIYLFKDAQLALTYKGYKAHRIRIHGGICVYVCVWVIILFLEEKKKLK